MKKEVSEQIPSKEIDIIETKYYSSSVLFLNLRIQERETIGNAGEEDPSA